MGRTEGYKQKSKTRRTEEQTERYKGKKDGEMEKETGAGSRTKGQTEKKERKKEGKIKMGTGSGTYRERKVGQRTGERN